LPTRTIDGSEREQFQIFREGNDAQACLGYEFGLAMPEMQPAPFCLIELHGSSKQPVASPEFDEIEFFATLVTTPTTLTRDLAEH
jgi:hypothetical protein